MTKKYSLSIFILIEPPTNFWGDYNNLPATFIMGQYTSGTTVDITKLRFSARKRRLVKEYDKDLIIATETLSPLLEDKTSFSRENEEVEIEERSISEEKKEEYEKHFNFQKKEEIFVDKYASNFQSREKYFKKRIEEEKWGDLKVQDVVEKLFELGTILTDINLYPYQVNFVKRIFLSVLLNDAEELIACYSRQCIAEGSIIHSEDGTICRIEEHPNSWLTDKNAEIIEIRVRGGRIIRCTKNHPVFSENKWVPAGELKKGDYVTVLHERDLFGNGRVPYSFQKNMCNNNNNDIKFELKEGVWEINNEIAELLGLIITNNYIIHRTQSIKFTNINPAILDRVEYLVKNNFSNIKVKRYKKGKGYYDLLLTTGVKNRFNTLKDFIKVMRLDSGFPKGVNHFTKEQSIHFLRACFTGYVHLKKDDKNIDIDLLSCGQSRVYAEYFHALLNKLGIHGQIKHGKMKKNKDGTEFHRIVISGHRNAEMFKKIIGEIPGKPINIPKHSRLNKIITHTEFDYTLTEERIVNIIEIGKGRVWDVTFPKTKWFICGGIKVHNSGKSTAMAFSMVTLCTFIPQLSSFFPQIEHLKKGIKIGVFAGNNLQVNNLMNMADTFIGSQRAKEIFRDPDLRLHVIKRKWSNGSELFAQSAAKQTRIESKSFQIIFIDECQDIDDEKILKSIHPMGAHWAATIIKSGTPIPKICELYRAVMRGKRKDLDRPKYRHSTFLVHYLEVQKHNKKYKHFVQLEKERIGEDSPNFRMAYGIEWLVEKGMVITPDIFETKLCLPHKNIKESCEGLCVAGLDLGKDMHSTVCTVIHLKPATLLRDGFEDVVLEHHILDWLEITHIDWDQQISTIKDFLKRYKGIKAVAFDSTGVGSAVFDLMKNYFRNLGIRPIPYKFNVKLKGELATTFDTLLHSNLIKIPASSMARRTKRWQKFYLQMTECERVFKNGITVFQKPDENEARDDYVDSLLLGLHAAQNKLLRVAQGSNFSAFTNSSMRIDKGRPTSFENLRKQARYKARANMVQSLMDRIKK